MPATADDIIDAIGRHEAMSQRHHDELKDFIATIENHETEGTEMNDLAGMLALANTGKSDASGLNSIMPLLMLSLLSRGGPGGFGGTGDGTGVAALNSNTLDIIQSQLGDIKASVPLAEGQVQLALAGATAQLMGQANSNTQALQAGQTAAALTASQNAAMSARDIASVAQTVVTDGALTRATVVSEAQTTRALITSNQIAELNRLAAERQDEIIELRSNNRADRDRHGVEITMTNNQNQNQLQFQQQSQVMGTLANVLAGLTQSIHATNQAINIGSGGLVANPNNNNTNVRA